MKFVFTIGRKIGLGFGIFIMLTLIVFSTTYVTVQESRRINDEINSVNTPSVKKLQELKFDILETRLFLEIWMKERKEHEAKEKLIEFREIEYPQIKSKLEVFSEKWNGGQADSLKVLFGYIDQLFIQQSTDIIDVFQIFEDYDENPFGLLYASSSLEEGGEIFILTEQVMNQITDMIEHQKRDSSNLNAKMFGLLDTLELLVRWFGFALIFIGIVIAFYTTRSIVRPIRKLKSVAIKLGLGVFPKHKMKVGDDEIGEMNSAMNSVISGLKSTKDFANAVGSGNFEIDYHPLSEDDSLGLALLKMRDELAENERILEEKVKLRTAEVVEQKEELDRQRRQIEEYFNQVTDSIKYAKRIQEAILPPESYVKSLIPDSFIFYKPKDIVSGDFYWMGETRNKAFFAAVDCTGHGVPGAFMSIVGHNQLERAVYSPNTYDPATILNYLNKGVTETLHQSNPDSISKDGMDIAMCSINYDTLELEYAGAFNPLYLLRNGEMIQITANKFPIGSFMDREASSFTNHKIQLQKGDQIYIFSDGYPDQFGGPRGKKFMYKQFRELLIKNGNLEMSEQKIQLRDTLIDWMKDEEQVDDILVIGVRV